MANKYLPTVMKYVDVLVDGRFEEELKDVNYHWAGSTNQRVIDVPQTLKEGKVVLYEKSLRKMEHWKITMSRKL